MLLEEDRAYKEEIVAMQETPEQTRERMAKRVKELKEEKERRRQEDVNQRLEKRFEQNADELRKVDKDLKELKLSYERNIQLIEKQSTMQNQYECTPSIMQSRCCSQSSTSATSRKRKRYSGSSSSSRRKRSKSATPSWPCRRSSRSARRTRRST